MNQLNQNKYLSTTIRFWKDIISKSSDPYGREGRKGSNIAFFGFLLIILLVVWWLPISVILMYLIGINYFKFLI